MQADVVGVPTSKRPVRFTGRFFDAYCHEKHQYTYGSLWTKLLNKVLRVDGCLKPSTGKIASSEGCGLRSRMA